MTELWPTISTTSLSAAKRQMDAAIRCLLSREDPLAVHTLAYASYGLLRDISRTQGAGAVRSQLEADAHLFPEKKFWKRFSELASALKHGDRTAVDVPEEFNEMLLVTNCQLLREIDRLDSAEAGAMWLWFHAAHFVHIDDAPDCYWSWIDQYWTRFHSTARQDRLLVAAPLYESLKNVDIAKYEMTPEHELIPFGPLARLAARRKRLLLPV